MALVTTCYPPPFISVAGVGQSLAAQGGVSGEGPPGVLGTESPTPPSHPSGFPRALLEPHPSLFSVDSPAPNDLSRYCYFAYFSKADAEAWAARRPSRPPRGMPAGPRSSPVPGAALKVWPGGRGRRACSQAADPESKSETRGAESGPDPCPAGLAPPGAHPAAPASPGQHPWARLTPRPPRRPAPKPPSTPVARSPPVPGWTATWARSRGPQSGSTGGLGGAFRSRPAPRSRHAPRSGRKRGARCLQGRCRRRRDPRPASGEESGARTDGAALLGPPHLASDSSSPPGGGRPSSRHPLSLGFLLPQAPPPRRPLADLLARPSAPWEGGGTPPRVIADTGSHLL